MWENCRPGWNYRMLHKPILSAAWHVLFVVAYSIETAVETEFSSERTVDEFVVFGMYGQ